MNPSLSPSPRPARLLTVAAFTAAVGMALAGVAMVVLTQRTGDVMFLPGSLHPTEHLVSATDGTKLDKVGAETMFVTVFAREATLFDSLIRQRLDPSVEFETREEAYGTGTKEESDKFNAQLMDYSKLYAQAAAFQEVGDEVQITGDGAEIREVIKDSPAEGHLMVSDVITRIDDTPIATVDDLRKVLDAKSPGDSATFHLTRDGKRLEIPLTLVADPDNAERAVVGIYPATANLDFTFPVKLKLESGDVSGPSAGLAWSLAIVDRLTPGDLSNGVPVAVTGEIAPDGSIGPIGGLPQKAVAVNRAGIKYFLVPDSQTNEEIDEANKLIDSRTKIRKVSSLEDAINFMEKLKAS